MVSAPRPPLAVNDEGALDTVIAHFVESGAVSAVEEDVQAAAAQARTAAGTAAARARACIRFTTVDLMHGSRQIAQAFTSARSSWW
jgi:hypothetical protein